MLRDPQAVKNVLLTTFGPKTIAKTQKKLLWNHLTYQPLVASHVCVCEC